MNQKYIWIIIIVVLLVAGAWFVFRGDTEEQRERPLAEKAVGVHYVGDGTHTVEGSIMLPNPCYRLSVTAEKRDAGNVLLRFTAEQTAELCAQVIYDAPFYVSFNAVDNAVLSATINDVPMALELTRNERKSADIGSEFVISFGESRWVEDAKLTFVGVEDDSRCPEDVVCVQAGWITLRFMAGDEELILRAPGDATISNAAVVGSYIITLLNVEPRARSKTELMDEDYTATIRVGVHDSKG